MNSCDRVWSLIEIFSCTILLEVVLLSRNGLLVVSLYWFYGLQIWICGFGVAVIDRRRALYPGPWAWLGDNRYASLTHCVVVWRYHISSLFEVTRVPSKLDFWWGPLHFYSRKGSSGSQILSQTLHGCTRCFTTKSDRGSPVETKVFINSCHLNFVKLVLRVLMLLLR